MTLHYQKVRETKTCCVYETGSKAANDLQTLYLKKTALEAAGISPAANLVLEIKEEKA